MLDDKMRSEIDQARAAVIELFPPLLFEMFSKLKEEGFTEDQAMKLTCEAMKRLMVPGGTP